jgi:hypothetical protein
VDIACKVCYGERWATCYRNSARETVFAVGGKHH